ncbi:hypothetical protein JCM15519_30610 [Fundidesulfovibrio butyratiphilus]
MKRFLLLAMVISALGLSTQAFAQAAPSWAGGWSTDLIDGPGYGAQTAVTPSGTGTCVPLLNGQGYGPGNGTSPQPQDGTGFGSPWTSR